MPSRDAAGKRLSGSALRKQAGAPLPPMTRAARKAFAAIGPPDLSEPHLLLSWARKVLGATLHLSLTDEIDAQRARLIRDQVLALGMSHSRGAIEAEVKDLRTVVARVKARSGAMQVVNADDVARPATARGKGGRRGPRALPGSVPGAEEGEDPRDPSDGGGAVG